MPRIQRSTFSFELPERLLAREPAEERGSSREDVRLMAIDRATGRVKHTNFENFPSFLKPGDLLVFNSSRTIPAAIEGSDSKTGSRIEMRLAEHLPDDTWLALLSCRDGKPFACGLKDGMQIAFGRDLSCAVERRDE
ncbi:MAG: S-adenosylmethionine:tRNA ribosyltransferase-isomerase, partial [Nitrososphaerales archaeon]